MSSTSAGGEDVVDTFVHDHYVEMVRKKNQFIDAKGPKCKSPGQRPGFIEN